MVHKCKFPLPPRENNFWVTLEKVAKVSSQQPASDSDRLFLAWDFDFATYKIGEVGEMISKLKLPLGERERVRFWFVSLYSYLSYTNLA